MLDIPGCGLKWGRVTDETNLDEIVTELAEDIDCTGIEDPVLVGHSQAGTITPRLVKSRPHSFRHVIYVSSLVPKGNQTALGDEHAAPGTDGDFTMDRRPQLTTRILHSRSQ